MADPKPTSKTLAAQREAARLSRSDVARFYLGGVSEAKLTQIENRKNVTRQVQTNYMQAIACAVVAKSTAKESDARFAVLLNKLAESQGKKEWRAMPNLPDCAQYLAMCSPAALQSFALARMGEVSNLLKEMAATFAHVVQQKAEAELAFWLLAHRQDLVHPKVSAVLPSVPVRPALPASRKMVKARKEEKR